MTWPAVKGPIALDVFFAELEAAGSSQAREAVLLHHIARLGYDTYLFGMIDIAEQDVTNLFFRSNMDPDWLKRYRMQGEAQYDPAVRHCLTTQEPLLWTELRKAERAGTYSREEAEVGVQAIEAGYHIGVTIPLHVSWSPHVYGMTFTRFRSTDGAGHDRMFHEYATQIKAVARLFLTCFDLAEEFKSEFNLSDAQWQLIEISFRFKNRTEQATVLQVEPYTVKNRWTEIFKKFDEHQRSQDAIRNLAVATGAIVRPLE